MSIYIMDVDISIPGPKHVTDIETKAKQYKAKHISNTGM